MSTAGFDITIDLTALSQLGMLFELARMTGFPATQAAMRTVGKVIQATWIDHIRSMTPNDLRYISEIASANALQYELDGDPFAVGVFGGERASVVEFGSRAWDMKPALLHGRKFVNIMFRHALQGRKSGGTLYDRMPPEISEVAKKLKTYHSQNFDNRWRERFGRASQDGKKGAENRIWLGWGKRTKILTELNEPVFRDKTTIKADKPELAAFGRATYEWRNGKYDDMVALRQKTERGGSHSQYVTWRRLSINSPTNSWWYPAIDAKPLIPSLLPKIEPAIQSTVMSGMMVDLGLKP